MQFFFVNVLITIVIELLINNYVVRKIWHEGPSSEKVLFANLISNPTAQIIYRFFKVNLWIMELGVVVFETVCFMRSRKNIGKALITSVVLNTASVFVGILLIVGTHTQAVQLLIKCTTISINNSCVIDHATDARVLTQLAELRSMNFVFGDFRNYALNLHHLGADYFTAHVPFNELLTQCPPLMKDGCVHGYVMQLAYKQGIDQAIKQCTATENERLRFGCMHALGHSYLEQNNFSVQDAEKNFCRGFTGTDYRACVSGLFHEYTKGGTHTEHSIYYHTHKIYIAPDCSAFTGDMVTYCYAAQGSFRQYYPDAEPLPATYDFCETAPTTEAKQVCRDGAYERIMISKGQSVVIK